MTSYFKAMKAAMEEKVLWLLSRDNVVAVGIGIKKRSTGKKQTMKMSIVCSVSAKKHEMHLRPDHIIPKKIDIFDTDVQETGEFSIFWPDDNNQLSIDPKIKHRPAPGGVSIGHFNVTAGTLGCYVTNGEDVFVLSNNHVLANSNDAQIGDKIYQPGVYDGGTNADVFAYLHDYAPIHFIGENDDGGGDNGSTCRFAKAAAAPLNLMAKITGAKTRLKPVLPKTTPKRKYGYTSFFNEIDAAIALPVNFSGYVDPEIIGLGLPVGSGTVELRDRVSKFGRTTELTHANVEQMNVFVNVGYGDGKIAMFKNQIMTGSGFSAGGDSGSAVLNRKNEVIGLLFAGSSRNTILNPINAVTKHFDVIIYGE